MALQMFGVEMKNGLPHGFTMLELLSVMVVLSLFTLSFWGPEIQGRVQDFKRAQVDVMVEEMRRIGVAAQKFAVDNNGNWPNQNERCARGDAPLSLNAADLESPLYSGPAAANQTMPFPTPSGVSAKLGYYYFHCAEKPVGTGHHPEFILRVAFAEDNKRWRPYIANQFAGSAALDHADYPGLELAWPLPAAVPLLDGFLPRDGSASMRGDLDMDNHALYGASDVLLETGQTLGAVPLLHSVMRPGNVVLKPSCPTWYRPYIMVTPATIAHDSGAAVSQFKVWAEDYTSSWVIKSQVVTEAGVQDDDNASKVLVGVTVKCAA